MGAEAVWGSDRWPLMALIEAPASARPQKIERRTPGRRGAFSMALTRVSGRSLNACSRLRHCPIEGNHEH